MPNLLRSLPLVTRILDKSQRPQLATERLMPIREDFGCNQEHCFFILKRLSQCRTTSRCFFLGTEPFSRHYLTFRKKSYLPVLNGQRLIETVLIITL